MNKSNICFMKNNLSAKRISAILKTIIVMLTSLLICSSIYGNDKINNQYIINASETDLKKFIDKILEENPAIQAAKANIAAGQARLEAAEQPLYNPELIAETEQKRQTSFKDPELALEGNKPYEKTYTAGINQTIDLANKRRARSKVADRNVHVAELQLASLRQQLSSDVLNGLIRYQAAHQVVSLTKDRTALLEKFVALTEKRQSSGDVARVETDLAQLALSESLAQQAEAEVNENQILQSLRAITGLNYINWPSLPNLPHPNVTNQNVIELLNCLPSLQVLNEQFQTAQMRIQLAKRERFPDPTLGIQGGRENTDEGNKRVLMATFSIPLYIRNSYRAEVEAAGFDAIEAEKKKLDTMRQVKAEIISTAERYQTLYQTLQNAELISNKPLNDGMTLIERLWQSGELSTTDYLVQFKQRIDSQIAVAELRSKTWQAWGDWLKASGTVENWLQHT